MGRASNSKKRRRAERAELPATTPKNKGGRPRIHTSAAARTAAWRARRKAGETGRLFNTDSFSVADRHGSDPFRTRSHRSTGHGDEALELDIEWSSDGSSGPEFTPNPDGGHRP
jgi:hypothetical protein